MISGYLRVKAKRKKPSIVAENICLATEEGLSQGCSVGDTESDGSYGNETEDAFSSDAMDVDHSGKQSNS